MEEKERIYRQLALDALDSYRLSPGAVALLDELTAGDVPRAIATSSPWVNVAFFIDRLDLHRWFAPEVIIYDRGQYPGKPAPGIYLEAAACLGGPPRDYIVVEDSVAGIEAARRAGVGAIVGVAPVGEQLALAGLPGVGVVIANLSEFPRHWLRRVPENYSQEDQMDNQDSSLNRPPVHSDAERVELLRLARETIAHFLQTGELLLYQTEKPWFLSPAAVFVTLRVRPSFVAESEPGEEGPLRGCIGQVEADQPLYLAAQDAAIKAATGDPRFYPVAAEELEYLSIEISVLSPLRPIDELDEILIGQDGLLIVGDRRRGLLLPEVAERFGWRREEFVRAVCQKAGLPEDAWPGRARLYAFTTESFEEDRP
jgi:AmmeMemoRadiSam system protein A